MIEVDNLCISFGRHEAVRSVSFAVGKGQCFGLVGESGSGKSTLLRAIARLNPHWSGRIDIAGQDQRAMPPKSFFRLVQMIFQDPYGSLHPRQTVDRILSEPLLVHGFTDVESRVRRALDEVLLPRAARFRFPHQLSGGQRQRVAIARAIISEPSILLLDEPTSALDVSVQAEILNLFSDLREARNLTYVLVSHNLPVVAHLCERVGVMLEGRIVEEISAAELRSGDVSHPHTVALRELSLQIGDPEVALSEPTAC